MVGLSPAPASGRNNSRIPLAKGNLFESRLPIERLGVRAIRKTLDPLDTKRKDSIVTVLLQANLDPVAICNERPR